MIAFRDLKAELGCDSLQLKELIQTATKRRAHISRKTAFTDSQAYRIRKAYRRDHPDHPDESDPAPAPGAGQEQRAGSAAQNGSAPSVDTQARLQDPSVVRAAGEDGGGESAAALPPAEDRPSYAPFTPIDIKPTFRPPGRKRRQSAPKAARTIPRFTEPPEDPRIPGLPVPRQRPAPAPPAEDAVEAGPVAQARELLKFLTSRDYEADFAPVFTTLFKELEACAAQLIVRTDRQVKRSRRRRRFVKLRGVNWDGIDPHFGTPVRKIWEDLSVVLRDRGTPKKSPLRLLTFCLEFQEMDETQQKVPRDRIKAMLVEFGCLKDGKELAVRIGKVCDFRNKHIGHFGGGIFSQDVAIRQFDEWIEVMGTLRELADA